MTNTMNCVAAYNAENNGENNNQGANPMPPPPPNLEQVLPMQAQMLQTMSTCMHNPKCHRRRGIGWEIFSALSQQLFLMLWSQWMLMTHSSLLRRSCK
jgi:hypothetical protein